MWPTINRALNAVFDTWLRPVSAFPDWVQLAWLAWPLSILALLAYRWTTNPDAIARAKDRMKAHILELRLYRDDLAVMLRAQVQIARHNLSYLRLSLPPVLLMLLPFAATLAQVESRFGYRPLLPGESGLLTVEVEAGDALVQMSSRLVVPAGIESETPALRIEAGRQLVWRLGARETGEHALTLSLGNHDLGLRASVGERSAAVVPAVYRADLPAVLAWPAAEPLPRDSMVRAVHLTYPRAGREFAGLSGATWLFTALVMGVAWLLRRPFGVTL
jgi:hypothetical protein